MHCNGKTRRGRARILRSLAYSASVFAYRMMNPIAMRLIRLPASLRRRELRPERCDSSRCFGDREDMRAARAASGQHPKRDRLAPSPHHALGFWSGSIPRRRAAPCFLRSRRTALRSMASGGSTVRLRIIRVPSSEPNDAFRVASQSVGCQIDK